MRNHIGHVLYIYAVFFLFSEEDINILPMEVFSV